MNVRELRKKLFEVKNQELEVIIVIGTGLAGSWEVDEVQVGNDVVLFHDERKSR